MSKIENKIVSFIQKHILLILIAVGLLLSLLLRLSLRGWLMYDMEGFLLPWYNDIKEKGIIWFISSGISDYHVLYQLLLYIATLLPFDSVTNIKLISIVFDYLTAIAMAYGIWVLQPQNKGRKLLATATLVISSLLPIVIFNSAMWGQCDIIYTFFIVLSVKEIMKDRYLAAFIMFSLSFAFKLQAVFFLPVLVIIYFVKKRFSAILFLLPPLVLFLLGLPAVKAGTVFRGFEIYLNQTSTWQLLTLNYPNIHTLFIDVKFSDHMLPAVITTLTILFLFTAYLLATKQSIENDTVILLSVWSILTCTMFLPGMHDRYGFAAELLVWFYFLFSPSLKRFLLALSINFVPMVIYIRAFVNSTYLTLATMSLFNILVYIGLTIFLVKEIKNNQIPKIIPSEST